MRQSLLLDAEEEAAALRGERDALQDAIGQLRREAATQIETARAEAAAKVEAARADGAARLGATREELEAQAEGARGGTPHTSGNASPRARRPRAAGESLSPVAKVATSCHNTAPMAPTPPHSGASLATLGLHQH